MTSNKYVYVIKMFDTNLEAYLSLEEAKARAAEIRAFQSLLMQTALQSTDENFAIINSFYDENLNIYVDKIPLK